MFVFCFFPTYQKVFFSKKNYLNNFFFRKKNENILFLKTTCILSSRFISSLMKKINKNSILKQTKPQFLYSLKICRNVHKFLSFIFFSFLKLNKNLKIKKKKNWTDGTSLEASFGG